MFNYLTQSVIPIIVIIIITYGMFKGRKVYEWFIEGAKEGLQVCLNIFPYLLAMIVAVHIFRESNLLDMLNNLIAPFSELIGLPKEVTPLVLVKPLSGSGAMGILTDILKTYGPDTSIGYIASVIMGTTETIFYTITVYFGAIQIKKIRHTIWASLFAEITAIIAAIFLVGALIL
ncbi:spore maturation protein [Clostridium septicum]|uniref:Spore maturation protein n=1 Tax=Clostridium septicum TaxID=1504 RepID=A0A9N7PLA4_CLOSE|nr:nucleoside recognition domain-containing protein [Clostridium septicum]AYE34411.1 spore maturation protein [Clostridium septicum]MDU1312526.1 nucleoside recognition domain-containing protein [Clostridium septicum]QAS59816.1 spore maturation protein [Clostridium septicum]UEC20945.1 spore maturation protein [Clostridium septicum]USS01007.1 spore maturation protein [Clostridium septicum]